MLLRKLLAALGPLALCAAVCALWRRVDGWLGSAAFWGFALKGAALGAALALVLPVAGVHARTNGLTGWLLAGAALLLAVLGYQFMESTGMVHLPVLRSLLPFNGQVVLAEGAAAGYLATVSLLYRHR